MINEQELREAHKVIYRMLGELNSLSKRIDAALERKPKWYHLPSGEWAKISHVAYSDGCVWLVDKKANNFYAPLRNAEFGFDDNPPAEEPLPCPNCKHQMKIESDCARAIYWVACTSCHVCMPGKPSPQDAVSYWNWQARQLHGMKKH
jgi:hypothetical protein